MSRQSSITPRHGRRIPERVFERLDDFTVRGAIHVPRMSKPCAVWIGTINGAGYGQLGFCEDGAQFNVHTHWLAYIRARLGGRAMFGDRVQFNHRCDVRLCVEPDHIYLGTPHDNVRDWRVRGRSEWTCIAEDFRLQMLLEQSKKAA